MIDVRKARSIVMEIEAQYLRRGVSAKWNEIYKTENEIIEDLLMVHVPETKQEEIYCYGLYKGYQYINSFAKRVQSGNDLTDNQMKQCKRLAIEIKKAASISCCY